MSYVLFALYILSSCLLLVFGFHAYVMIILFRRARGQNREADAATEADFAAQARSDEDYPFVTTQIPLFNEYNVAERVIRAVVAMDYPSSRHEIQVLDDSTDDTRELTRRVVADLQAEGVGIVLRLREARTGYKAGALQAGLREARGEFIAIFDSDFVPPADFLKRTVAHLHAKPEVGLVQARWGHLNEEDSPLTRAQGLGVDGHFVIEQPARSRNGLFMNFCGTAGLWRKETIDDAGGWQHDTVTEDLDLSYRAQLRGWIFHYLPDLVVPAELPPNYQAFKSQQYRWAKGSIQTARKVLPSLWTARLPLATKLEGTIHLLQYSIHLFMAILAFLIWPVQWALHGEKLALYQSWIFIGLLIPATLGPSLAYLICLRHAHPADWRDRFWRIGLLILVGFGICLSNARAVLAGLFSSDTTFVRTPKAGASPKGLPYRLPRGVFPYFELSASLYCLASALWLAGAARFEIIPFVLIYAIGLAMVGWSSLRGT